MKPIKPPQAQDKQHSLKTSINWDVRTKATMALTPPIHFSFPSPPFHPFYPSPPPSHSYPPPPTPYVHPPPPSHPFVPPPSHVHPPPPPPHHPIAPPPPHVHPPPHPLPPPPSPDNHPTVIVIVFVCFGGILFLSLLSFALFCLIKKRKKKTQETDIIHFDEHKKVTEAIVPGPCGEQVVVLSVEDDVHIDEQIIKTEELGHGLHAKPLNNIEDTSSSNLDLGTKEETSSSNLGAGTTSSDHDEQHHHQQLENKP